MGKGRSGGGGDRFQQMAAQRDAMSQRLIDSLDKLGNAISQISGGISGSGGVGGGSAPGVAGGAVGASVAQAASAGAAAQGVSASWWNSGVKSDSSLGLGMNAVRQTLSSSGAGTASSLLGGFYGGALAGGLAAGSLLGGMVIKDAISPYRAGENAAIEARSHASVYRGRAYGEYVESLKNERATIQDQLDSTIRDVATYAFQGRNEARVRRQRLADQQALVENRLSEFTTVEESAESRIERYLAPFAEAGVSPTKSQVESLAPLAIRQATAQYQMQADVQAVVAALNLARPGGQSNQARTR